MPTTPPPVVLLFGGTDPTGGAGLAADTLAVASLGCHPAPVVTAVTAQDTTGVKQYLAMPTELIIAQARAVLEDMSVAAFKTGMLCNAEVASAVASIVEDYADIPLVVDPVQASGATHDSLSDEPLEEALRVLLLPRATLATPNIEEAKLLAPGADTIDACAQELLSLGCQYVLITGTHDATPQVVNRLYGHKRLIDVFKYERLAHTYHGSGCTLASACAAALAHRLEPTHAVAQALDYTWNTLQRGHRLGMGQYLPDRLYWGELRRRLDPNRNA
jgi:hydroxymethylpyrimidine/phosphomethylpyrimidine kinase